MKLPAWVPYTLWRLGLFAALFAVMWLLQIPVLLAAVFAAIAAAALSVIFLQKQRDAFAQSLVRAKKREVPDRVEDPDNDYENSILDVREARAAEDVNNEREAQHAADDDADNDADGNAATGDGNGAAGDGNEPK